MLAPGEMRPPLGGRRGADSGVLGIVPEGDVLLRGGTIAMVGSPGMFDRLSSERASGDLRLREIDACGRVLMPGFVDCHTHACWVGSRIDEWERKLAGATYQEIAASGGGIMSTVRAVRTANIIGLGIAIHSMACRMVRLGSTTIEVKSGYGLTRDRELKLLRAIVSEGRSQPWTICPTALLGHAVDPESASEEAFVEETIKNTLPAVSKARPGIAVDAFCEKGAWSLQSCARLFKAAIAAGHPVRVHADQFTSLGMVEEAIALGAKSVDHLEASTPQTLAAIAVSETFGVGLPICGFHLDGRYARLREIIERGGKVCVATNYNPGSAPSPSMAFAIALAVRHCGLTAGQAIVAATLNPALLLGYSDRGYIAPGARADLILLRHRDERALAYEVGDSPIYRVICGGAVLDLWHGMNA